MSGLLFVAPLCARAARGAESSPNGAGRLTQAADSAATQTLERAKELFDEERWAEAVARFDEFVRLYPRDRNVPAAHYWLAVALKKQGKYGEAARRAERLIEEFPRSDWATEARALRAEIAGLSGDVRLAEQAAADEDDNVKLVALQSLLQLDPERGLQQAAAILRPDSGASANLQTLTVTLLGRRGERRAAPILSEVARGQRDAKLRVRAVYALAQIDDPLVFDTLKALATGTQNGEVAEAALAAIALSRDARASAFVAELARSPNVAPETRKRVILLLGQREGGASVDELISIYDAADDGEIKKQSILALGQARDARAQAKLLEVARQGEDEELRASAILGLGQRGEAQALESLAQLFDEEKSEEVKGWIIVALGQSGSSAGAKKLMAVAQSDASPRLRQMAVESLRRSTDPEVQKFLQAHAH